MYFSPHMQDDRDIEPVGSSNESSRKKGRDSMVDERGAGSFALQSLELDESLSNDEAEGSRPKQRAVYQARSGWYCPVSRVASASESLRLKCEVTPS